ncbi:MAG: cysteine--tRNA ligase [Burkholderiaceae bacterium]|nr:MAG: cysteine--tRNA ligase [Burkholderiaceae bacterium]
MSLHLYDTAARRLREFVPIEPGTATIYVCGATVQSAPHVGHVRSGVAFDVLVRWLTANGVRVTLCRNVTDIDDKILVRAIDEGRPWWAVATAYERAFTDAYRVLGCLPPTVEPRATGHIPQMLELIGRLIDSGHAYASDGDVYFAVGSFPRYGQLSGQRPDDVQPAADTAPDARKRDPRDFALWKSAKPGEPAWDSPWGPGRPGWHIECSAMATTYLGDTFDIHGGGRDLVFPHHENEVAQSQGAGDGFARYWLHNAWVTTAGEKMSKSLGNSLLVSEVAKRVRPVELRWYLSTPHYRSTLEFSDAALAESAAGYRRLEGFVLRAAAELGAGGAADPAGGVEALPAAFVDAMDDDLNVPGAVAVLHETVTAGNQAQAVGDRDALAAAYAAVRAMLAVLGADPLSEPWTAEAAGAEGGSLRTALDTVIGGVLELRAQARANRDFATADAIRDNLAAAGIAIEDTAGGSRWSLKRSDG